MHARFCMANTKSPCWAIHSIVASADGATWSDATQLRNTWSSSTNIFANSASGHRPAFGIDSIAGNAGQEHFFSLKYLLWAKWPSVLSQAKVEVPLIKQARAANG
jgi:hypothetical protein